jgi:hypothetical protein
MCCTMSEERPSDVLGALPRTRPHRRSDKRGAPQAATRPPPGDAAEATNATPNIVADQMTPDPPASQPTASTASKPSAKTTSKPSAKTTSKPRAKTASKPMAKTASKPSAKTASEPSASGPTANATPKRPPAPAGPRAPRLRQPAQPDGTPAPRPNRNPAPPLAPDLVGTAVHAVAELAEIGLSVSARAIRSAVSKLPRPS